MPKIHLSTMGCPKNEADSDQLLEMLSFWKIEHTDNPEEAEIFIVNTCGFIEDAKMQSIEEILSLGALKDGKSKKLLVYGCLAKRYKQELISEIPEIDSLWEVNGETSIVQYCREHFKIEHPPDRTINIQSTKPYSYIKIADGCSRSCTFCVIPQIKGPFKSQEPEKVLKIAQKAINAGKKEIIVVAQDLTGYGKDIGYTLPQLITDLASINGEFWIRLMYLYPTTIDESLIECIKREKKVCKYFDIPLQHCEKNILQAMGREIIEKDDLFKLINDIKKEIPVAVIRTTFIVGFPGETSQDFNSLMDFTAKVEFDRLGVFAYSKEEGTRAFAMGPEVPKEIVQQRMDAIMEQQGDISYNNNLTYVGKRFRALVDDLDESGQAMGRLYCHAPEIDGIVLIEGAQPPVGNFVDVIIKEADIYDLASTVI